LREAIEALPRRPTILYAPTWAGRDEWRRLLPRLAQLPVNVIVKNHTYATTPGEEVSEFYRISRESVAEMENAARGFTPAMVVAPPEINICSLFPYVDATITDQSSVAAEFLPWGVAVETGANLHGKPAPGTSRWYPGVLYRPLDSLMEELADGKAFFGKYLNTPRPVRRVKPSGAGKVIADMIWEKINQQGAAGLQE